MHKIFYNSILRLTFLLSLLVSLFLSFSLSFFKDTARELGVHALHQASKINRRRFSPHDEFFSLEIREISLSLRVELQVRERIRALIERTFLFLFPPFSSLSPSRVEASRRISNAGRGRGRLLTGGEERGTDNRLAEVPIAVTRYDR